MSTRAEAIIRIAGRITDTRRELAELEAKLEAMLGQKRRTKPDERTDNSNGVPNGLFRVGTTTSKLAFRIMMETNAPCKTSFIHKKMGESYAGKNIWGVMRSMEKRNLVTYSKRKHTWTLNLEGIKAATAAIQK